jgi:hypothetical protein
LFKEVHSPLQTTQRIEPSAATAVETRMRHGQSQVSTTPARPS